MGEKILIALFSAIMMLLVFSPARVRSGHNIPSSHAVVPAGWYSGDIHVHRNCGEGTIVKSPEDLQKMMEANGLNVISVLADMGNGEVYKSNEDLLQVNGRDAPQSRPNRIVHWDAEWHWDATYTYFGHQALGGHLVLLGLQQASQLWEESPYKILDWSKQQGSIAGFAHLQYLADTIQQKLNCCIPIDLPVEAALGTIDFVSEDVYSNYMSHGPYNSEAAIQAYYKLLNCGFRLGLAAGTDYPCNDYEPLGSLLTYVRVDGDLTYKKWINGIKNGHTVVSRSGNSEFLDFTVNLSYRPGDEMQIKEKTNLPVTVNWISGKEETGTIELIQNGKVIATRKGISKPGNPLILSADVNFSESSWIAARRMNAKEHVTHTAPVYVNMDGRPLRTAREAALYYLQWIDNILQKIQPGQPWHHYFTKDAEAVNARYRKAKAIFAGIVSASE